MNATSKKILFGLLLIVLALGAFMLLNEAIDTDESDDIDSAASSSNAGVSELSSEYFDSYTIDDTGFGTMVDVVVDTDAETRTITSNALPNHDTGDFPNQGNPNSISEQDTNYTFPLTPSHTGQAATARTPGVAVNGVKFQPGTAEVASCESGEQYRIEAIQEITDLGLDFNNAHVQPTGEYHYHGASNMLVEAFDGDNDLVHIGFAADGHMMYYSKSKAYSASYKLGDDDRAGTNCTYTTPSLSDPVVFGSQKDGSVASDWEYNESYGNLDECNGTYIDGVYIYLVTEGYPYISRCLMGEFIESGGGGGEAGPTGGQQGPPPTGQGAPQGQPAN